MAAKFTLGKYKPDDKIFNITDVEDHHRLNFECIICKNPLTCVLKQGKVSPHFKHRNQKIRCKPALETLLHLTAKKIISSTRQILLPDHRGKFTYMDAQLEQQWNKYRPDLTLTTEDKPIYVEIVVSSPISEEKDLAYFQHRSDCLVIDLSSYPRLFAMSDLENDVLWNLENRSLLYQHLAPVYRPTSYDSTDDSLTKVILGVAAFGAGYFFYKRFLSPKKGFKSRR